MTAAPEPKRRGRPPVPPEKRAKLAAFRLSPSSLAKLRDLAAAAGSSQSAWIEAQIAKA